MILRRMPGTGSRDRIAFEHAIPQHGMRQDEDTTHHLLDQDRVAA